MYVCAISRKPACVSGTVVSEVEERRCVLAFVRADVPEVVHPTNESKATATTLPRLMTGQDGILAFCQTFEGHCLEAAGADVPGGALGRFCE